MLQSCIWVNFSKLPLKRQHLIIPCELTIFHMYIDMYNQFVTYCRYYVSSCSYILEELNYRLRDISINCIPSYNLSDIYS